MNRYNDNNYHHYTACSSTNVHHVWVVRSHDMWCVMGVMYDVWCTYHVWCCVCCWQMKRKKDAERKMKVRNNNKNNSNNMH
jgi:hypothetical protein